MNCPKCGYPLYKGNIKIVRKKGKRPRREHRACPSLDKFVETTRLGDKKRHFTYSPPPPEVKPEIFKSQPNRKDGASWGEGTAGNPVQRPQDTTGGPFTTEIVRLSEPPRYRYFMTPDQAERVKRALEKQMANFGVGFEVIPVPEYQVEQNPEAFAHLIEVKIEWKL